MVESKRRAISDTLVWWPLGFGAGIAAFFHWPVDPSVWSGFVALASLFFAWLRWGRKRERVRYILLALTLFSAGFAVSALHTHLSYAPRWQGGDDPVEIQGRILDATPAGRGLRVLLGDLTIEDTPAPPAKIRLVCRNCTAADVPVGAVVKARGVISPPAGPAREGGFDYRFNAYFQQLGGIGFTYGKPQIVAPPEIAKDGFMAAARQKLIGVAEAAIANEDTKALAIALLTGIQTSLPDGLRDAYQSSGLAHIYSVSGLHLSFVAGFLFFLFRGAMALFPPLALRYPTKKIAAIMALVAVTLFTLFAGDSVPTWRSLLMIALALLAVMTDRFAFSLRVVALAALVILALRPDLLFSISFQLSFAAVTALIAWVEWVQKPRDNGLPAGLVTRHGRILRDVLVTSLLATLATLPFILYYFGRVSPYAVFANLFGVPWTGFVIMPLVLLVLLGFMAGLAAPLLVLLAPFLWVLNEWAYWVAQLPHADVRVAAVPPLVVMACTLTLYAVCVYPRKVTVGLLTLSYLALLVFALRPVEAPRAYLSEKGLFAYMDGNTLWVSAPNKDKFVRNQWLVEQGLSDKAVKTLPREGGRCDRSACVLGDVVLIRKALALPSYCAEAYHIVAPRLTVTKAMCPNALSIMDYRALRHKKTSVLRKGRWHSVHSEQESIRIWERP